MRKFALATLALAFSGSSYAADLPRKAPVMAPLAPIAPSWTGFYFGGHAGAAWQSRSDMTVSDPNLPVPAALRTVSLSGNSDARFLGGIHSGYNWQFDSRWVLGVEGDISWTDIDNRVTSAPLFSNAGLPFLASSFSISEKVNWLASLRARLGFVAWPNTLIYATGGVAWENVDYNAVANFSATPPVTASFSKTNTGFVVGGGIEWQAFPQVLLRAEYLFYGFNQDQSGFGFVPAVPLPLNFNWSNSNAQVVRLGASYKF